MSRMRWALAAGLMASPLAVQAFETSLNGFISVGVGTTLKDGQSYVTDPVVGAAYDNELSIKPDTMVALQSSSRINDRLSATAQIAGYAGRGFETSFEWAYVSYDLTDELTTNFGRIRLPVFAYSSSLDLGYSYVWVRPPAEVYNVIVTSLEGVSVDYDFSLGGWYGTLSGYYGETEGLDPETQSYVEFESILGGIVTVENGTFSVRGSYSYDGDVNLYTDDSNNDGVNSIADDSLNLPIAFSSVSTAYDNGTVLLNGEVTLTQFTNHYNNDELAWYTTAGVRIGEFTPHITFSQFKQRETVVRNDEPVVQTLMRQYAQNMSSWTVGLRWDFDIAASAKIEYTSRTDKTELIPDNLLAAGFRRFGDAQTISLAVDVVF